MSIEISKLNWDKGLHPDEVRHTFSELVTYGIQPTARGKFNAVRNRHFLLTPNPLNTEDEAMKICQADFELQLLKHVSIR